MTRFATAFIVAMLTLAALVSSAEAQNRITCTGTLIDVDTSPRASWPLAAIRDTKGGHVCTIDRTGSGHDPLRPCNVGETCRVVGTARKVRNTFQIKTLIDVDNVQE